jgi:glycosyltransferase involved in cell wall biosynthesis
LKLVIQIPCYNEAGSLKETLAGLPRQIPGIDSIEVLIIDDGSSDGTADLATALGVHHVVRLLRHQGLATAFMAGIDRALVIGADIIVNTDADHQYPGSELPNLVAPIVQGRADLVIGDRQTDTLGHFSPGKRLLQRWGSRILRQLSRTNVQDAPSGFRAISRDGAMRLFVHNRFTYTLETVILAGQCGLSIENVPVRVERTARPSRLFRSTPDYVRRAGAVVLRAYAMYQPLRLVGALALLLLLFGLLLGGRFLYYYVQNPNYSGYVQSLVVATGAMVIAFLLLVTALLAELIASNRRLLEEVLYRVRRLDLDPREGHAPTLTQDAKTPPQDATTTTGREA